MNKTEPAFPTTSWDDYNKKSVPNVLTGGLTKREYFAAMAMQGLLSNPHYIKELENGQKQQIITDMNSMCVREALEIADELLKQLSK